MLAVLPYHPTKPLTVEGDICPVGQLVPPVQDLYPAHAHIRHIPQATLAAENRDFLVKISSAIKTSLLAAVGFVCWSFMSFPLCDFEN